jgi:hypothetical protein
MVKDNLFPSQTTVGGPVAAKGLIVRIAATHAGIVNRNNMFYLPDKMRDGAKTFTEHFQKPILLNHDEHSDPIGRVVGARYVDTSLFVKDKYRGKVVKDSFSKKIGPFPEKLFDSFVDGSMGYGSQVDFVRTYLRDNILDDPDYQGLGYVEITANITDEAAIEKFLDGRYLTGSVGAATDRASCAVCKQDWTKEGPCDHRPGKIYDGVKCHLIAGNFMYDEYSIANKPADRHSKVLELNFNGVKDSIKVEDTDFSGKLYEVRVEFPKEDDMKIKDSEGNTPDPKKEEEVTPPIEDTTPPEETLEVFLIRVLDASKGDLSDVDDEKLYSLMLDEMKAASLSEKEIEDSKLSAEKRKMLPKTSFGLANRALPLTDKVHILAAKKLLDKYTGKKDEILAVVDRKAKALGVEDVITPPPAEVPAVVQAMDKLDNNQLKEYFASVVAYVTKKNSGAVREMYKAAEPALMDEVVALETKLGALNGEVKKLTDSHSALKEEYTLATKEAEVLQDEVVKTKAKLREVKFKSLSLYKSLKTGTLVDVASLDETLADATLDSELDNLAKDVDIKKITDKLSDGTTRKPSGTVENPASAPGKETLDPTAVRDRLANIRETYTQLKFKNSDYADRWLADQMNALKALGWLPEEVK